MALPKDDHHEEVVSLLHNELAVVHWQWLTWRTLYADEERRQLLEKSAWPFFWNLQQVLLNQVFVSLSCLVDQVTGGRDRDNLTLERLLLHPRVAGDPSFHEEVKQKIGMARAACAKILIWRNKVLAHLDLKTVLAGANISLPPVNPQEVEDTLRALGDAFNAVQGRLYGQTTAFDQTFSPPGDAQSLLRCLQYSERWKAYQQRLLLEGRYEGGLL